MGVCVCKGKVHQSLHDYISTSLLSAIEMGQRSRVEELYRRFMTPSSADQSPAFQVDEAIIILQEVPLNSLSYAVRAGQCQIARFLIEVAHADEDKLYETYAIIGRTPMDIACEFGFLDLVQYLLAGHLKKGERKLDPSPWEGSEELSIFSEQIKHRATTLKSELTLRPMSSYQPPIHRACEHGHIEIVQWLYLYFKSKPTPRDFDINAVDEKAGENCALIAARTGDLDMVRMLNECCSADFKALNRRRENAIQTAVTGAKRRPDTSFLAVVRYLVEVVGVDITYEYEETLLICDDKTLIFYLENVLQQHGILTSKAKVELENSLTRNRPRRQMTKKSQELDQKCRQIGPKFLLRDLFADASRGEDISSIPPRAENSEGGVTPF